MSKTNRKGTASHKVRNIPTMYAMLRNGAGPMHDKRAERGGSKNRQAEYLDEIEADQWDELQEALDAEDHIFGSIGREYDEI